MVEENNDMRTLLIATILLEMQPAEVLATIAASLKGYCQMQGVQVVPMVTLLYEAMVNLEGVGGGLDD